MKKRIGDRVSGVLDCVRDFFSFVRRLPGFYRLNRFWDKHPRFYWDTINNYIKVMYELTDGHYSHPGYNAQTVIDEAYACMDKHWREEHEEHGNTVE